MDATKSNEKAHRTSKSQPVLKIHVYRGRKQLPPADVAAAEQNVLKAEHAQDKNEGYAEGVLVPTLEINVIETGLFTLVRLQYIQMCVHTAIAQ
jgi:hypothetical protein